ncbi:MAG: hypothetical protein ACTSWY_03900, partial [Promethearchaeota archaeon]
GKRYSGMRIGSGHNWDYNNGKWVETKRAPDKWEIKFDCVKTRHHNAPENSGCEVGSKFHWLILADQTATKLDSNSYNTTMRGMKFKMGHKRPYWRKWNYEYKEQISYKERIIEYLEDTVKKLKKSSSTGFNSISDIEMFRKVDISDCKTSPQIGLDNYLE